MKIQNNVLKTMYVPFALLILIPFLKIYSCGGGVVPYVPTQSGASGASTTASNQFFIFEKGVASDMFNIKKHQPIFRNIILTGNERTKNKPKKNKTDRASKEDSDSTVISEEVDIMPILNIHRLH